MCGIAGFVGPRGADARTRLTRMADLLTHRGPDERGLWLGDGVGLACRRLAIVDVAHGQQPIRHPESGAVVVFNGEIYGYRALRDELTTRGHRFETSCDTEVLLAGWLAFGEGVFERVDGMLACAIWAPATRELVLARDRFGKKPLYYAVHEGALWFASEMKALLTLPGFERRLDPKASEHFLLFEHLFDPMTPFAGVHALPPAHVLRVRADRLDASLEPRRYWSPPIGAEEGGPATLDAAAEELAALFGDAVARRTTGDVPVGALLSGGIDSSLVCQSLRPRDAFSIGFADPRLDESAHQDAVAAHVGARLHRFDFDAHVPAIAESYAEAQWLGEYADPSFEQDILIRHVTELAADQGYKVLLGGEGADELFRGYRHYAVHPHLARYVQTWDLEEVPEWLGFDDDDFADLAEAEAAGRAAWGIGGQLMAPGFPFGELLDPGAFGALAGEVFVAPPAAARPALPAYEPPSDPSSLDALQLAELHTRLPAYILRTLDRYSMASSVEVRCPFLDHRLFEWFARLPKTLRDAGPGDKPLLRRLAADRLPASIVDRSKQGFLAPCLLTESLRAPAGRASLEGLLAPAAIEALGVVRPAWVTESIDLFTRPEHALADDPAARARARILERVISLRLLASVFIDELDTYADAHLARHGVG